MDKKRELTPEELDNGRKVYARLSYGYNFARTPSPRTPDEQSILDMVARRKGRDYVERWAESILDQARAFGDL